MLGVSEALYGVFGLTMAAGALPGSQSAAALARRAGRGRSLWIGIVATGSGGIVAAATTSPFVAGIGLAIVGWANMVFNVVNVSLRQLLTLAEMLGRVMATYRSATVSIMLVGALVGGAVAAGGGLRLPWSLLGAGFLATAALMVRRLDNAFIDGAVPAGGDPDRADLPSR